MTRFIFEYEVSTVGKEGEFSFIAQTEDEARAKIRERIADMEFVENDEVIVGALVGQLAPNNNGSYFECEGCT